MKKLLAAVVVAVVLLGPCHAHASIDPGLGKAQARVAIRLANGARHAVFVEHAVGSVKIR